MIHHDEPDEYPKPARANRRSFLWSVRYFLGGRCTAISWRLLDPWDSWMVDYYDADGHKCARIIEGRYSVARTMAKRDGGKVVGSNASRVEA